MTPPTKPTRIAFVHAVDKRIAETQMFGIHFMPVWAYTLAAHLSDIDGLELTLHDLRVQEADFSGVPADVYLFTGINQDFEAILETARAFRAQAPHALMVIGGPICWSYETAGRIEKLAWFDHILVGDGEEMLPAFIRSFLRGESQPKLIHSPGRFDLGKARLMHDGILSATIERYYGGVLEVSRGCPFLCEFCDIRVQPDNNRSHVKPAGLIVEELDRLHRLGVRQTLFACDNFIGNHVWAEEVCDRIIEWKTRTGSAISLYTWLTIDVSRHPRLLRKLRSAGFDMFFIGVESFNRTSLLETAKVQNTSLVLVDALRAIQSYGFIVVAGLIMGFDTDPDNIVDLTLAGILDAGLISGDPSLLTALPGTPLYRRMHLSGRLRDAKLGLGGFKYQTNIRYLRPAANIRADFKRFVREFNRGAYQLRRLKSYLACINGPNYLPPVSTRGYSNLGQLFAMTLRHPKHLLSFGKRVFILLRRPERLWSILLACSLIVRQSTAQRPLWSHFKFWIFNWSNSLVKYSALSDRDFDIESVPESFKLESLLPDGYDAASDSKTSASKDRSQRRLTTESLKDFIASRL